MAPANNNDAHCLMVIFGASGDLTKRKLVPSLFQLELAGKLPERVALLGVSRTEMSDLEFRKRMREFCQPLPGFTEQKWLAFCQRLHYEAADPTDYTHFERIKVRIAELSVDHSTDDNILFYLSVAPSLYEPIVTNIGGVGLVTEGKRWCSIRRDSAPWQRLIVEKPFGVDLSTAAHLNRVLGRVFEEESIYRIDHYLGKETVQNLLVFRFANSIFEPIWNRHYIDRVQITAAETVGVEGRGGFYEKAGALRDMIQSHLLQVMALIAMEPPNTMAPLDLRIEQRKALQAVRDIEGPAAITDAVRGQYGPGVVKGKTLPGYRQEQSVSPNSNTDTYAALRLHVDNWRWKGVPFYIRSGKAMSRKLTQIVVHFKPTPHLIFAKAAGARPANRIIINLQPDEGISLRFEGKVPGMGMEIASAVMDFDFCKQFNGQITEAYATLLLDAINGDQSLFKDRHEIESAWRIVSPVMNHWAAVAPDDKAFLYPAGSWGPTASDALYRGDGRWHNPAGEATRGKNDNDE